MFVTLGDWHHLVRLHGDAEDLGDLLMAIVRDLSH